MDIIEMLTNMKNVTLQTADLIDEKGKGVNAISNGKMTTGQAFIYEISKFLLYIAYGNKRISEGQAAVYEMVNNDGIMNHSEEELGQKASAIEALDGAKSLVLAGFKSDDKGSLLFGTFEFLGRVMVAMDEDDASQKRYEKYLNEMKSAI